MPVRAAYLAHHFGVDVFTFEGLFLYTTYSFTVTSWMSSFVILGMSGLFGLLFYFDGKSC